MNLKMKADNRILFLLIALPILLSSCRNNKGRVYVENLVNEWSGKEILFPTHSVFTRFASDTVSYPIPDSDYKVVVFVDSVGCISCKLQLPKWKEFMYEVDSLCDGNVPFVFFFQTKDVRELRYILRRDDFSHPVCIDTEDDFYKLNRFSGEMMFQTFLLDSGNHVKVIGNPIHNLSVKDLYLKEISRIKPHSHPQTTVQPDSVEYHYGTVYANTTVCKKIFLRNTGKEVFHIKGVTSSCDCMSVKYDWDEISPGCSSIITITYKADKTGDFLRTITIYGNIPDNSITLDFWGTVIE